MERTQRGQVLGYGLAALLIMAAVMVLLYNTGQSNSEKTRTVNAADAAAYSGGIWVARQLNFMAYTNRVMIANHVAVGHFISYMSWIRYVEGSSDTIRNLTRFVPYVNVATEILATWATYVRSGTEYFADMFVPAADLFNRSLHAAQLVAKANMLGVAGGTELSPLHEVMERTAQKYHPAMRVNDPDDLATLRGAVTGVQIVNEMLQLFSFTQRYTAESDDGVMQGLVQASLGPSAHWIDGGRTWQLCMLISCARLPGNLKALKSGTGEQVASENGLGWSATDELGLWKSRKKRRWSSYRWNGGTIAKGAATTEEFYSDYAGIHGYYAVEEPADTATALYVSAYTTLPIDAARPKPLLGMDTAELRLAALARVEIYYARPDSHGGGTDGEYANVFNPFWRARLTGYRPFFSF